MKHLTIFAVAACLFAVPVLAEPADDIADTLVAQANNKSITADSLPTDFAHLANFVRHDAIGQVLYSDGGPADGHVRHAQARFDTRPANAVVKTDKQPLFVVAFELVEEPHFSFIGFAAALERRLGTPDRSSNLGGAAFRTWDLKQIPGRTLTVARTQSSDNGEPVAIVQMIQNR